MKLKQLQEIKNKPLPDLQKYLRDYRGRLRTLKFDLAAGKVKNIREIREVKKMIARIMTILHQK